MAKKKDEGGTSAKAPPSKKVEGNLEAKPAGSDSPAPKGWRATLPIHPAAELFPLMSPDEVKDLAEDIEKNGLISPIALWREDSPDGPLQLTEGRSRLDAIESVYGPVRLAPPNIEAGDRGFPEAVKILPSSVDPYAYVVSANMKRRHLTAKQKREIVAALLKARPENSNRQIAETAKVHHETVGDVRDELEGRGEIRHVETRTDTKGRGQPARKGRGKRARRGGKRARRHIVISASGMDLPCCAETPESAEGAETQQGGAETPVCAPEGAETPEEAGGDVSGEAARTARLNALAEEIKSFTALDGDVRDFLSDLVARVTGMAAEQRAGLLRRLRQALDDPAPDDDGLDIPASLRRH